MSEVEVTQVDQEEYPEMHRVLELAVRSRAYFVEKRSRDFPCRRDNRTYLQKIWCGSSGFLCTE